MSNQPPPWPGPNPQPSWGSPQQPWVNPPGYPTAPQGYPPQFGGPPPPKNRKPLLITIGASVVVLVVIAVVTAALLLSGGDAEDTGDAAAGTAKTSGDASEVVKSYLEALSRGDAEAALSLGSTRPGSDDLLTDEVLKKQIDALPITDIEILGETAGVDADHVAVKAAARFGDRRSEGNISMVRDDNGWKLQYAFVNVGTLAEKNELSPDATLQIFGKPLDSAGHFYAFPGYLEAGTSTPFIAVTPPGPLGLDQLSGFAFLEFKYSMTDAGKKGAEDAVRAWLTKCYSPGQKPAYCNEIVGGEDWADYDTSTIQLTGPINLDGLKYTFQGVLRTVMVMGEVNDVPVTVRRKDGQTVPLQAQVWFTQQVDLGEDPATVVENK
ncbi:protein of unknown function [Mycolicibacterium rutilum]|uniref:Uncharacterized protein n=2 Tax=Mycolicibacterium rutilum TaxID=370526 RepID=A0A1H6IDE6_MYCRU|nr:protein of unknown function [Mycolicibacterium rutilum]